MMNVGFDWHQCSVILYLIAYDLMPDPSSDYHWSAITDKQIL